jgi:hypothetical protein
LYADSTYREVASELAAAIALERPDNRALEFWSKRLGFELAQDAPRR